MISDVNFLIFISYFYIFFGEMFFNLLPIYELSSGILYILAINPLSDVLVLNSFAFLGKHLFIPR